MLKVMDLCLLLKILDLNMVKKIIDSSKKIKNAASKFNQTKYGKMLKKEGIKVGKLAGKQLSSKIIPSAIDVAGSKIADKITSLKVKDEPEIKEQQEIIIPLDKITNFK